jgi:voltage-gated potassium channel
VKPEPARNAHRHENRTLLAHLILRMVVATTVLFATYAYFPVESAAEIGPLVRLIVGMIAVAVVLVWQVRRILSSSHPTIQAIEATVLAVVMFIVVFSLVYLGLSSADPATFSEALGRISAVYFTVTVLGTVGFGDIAARTDVARITVAVQMLLDLTLGVLVVRLLFEAARTTRSRNEQAPRPD